MSLPARNPRSRSSLLAALLAAEMTAAKRIILCLWLVLLGVAHAPAAVLDADENRVWEKIGVPSQTRLAESSQVAGRHQENAPPGWGTVSGCCLAAKTAPGKYTVGIYDEIRGTVPGLDAHHVGQKAVMGEFVPGYNPTTAPAILVPKVGHTIRGPNGIVSRSTGGFTSGRDVIARDIWEMRRVYPDVPNSQLQQLIQMNKDMYPILNK
jgi:hypothetical protein